MIRCDLPHQSRWTLWSATIRDDQRYWAMARFFFHFHDGTDQPDLTGTEFASLKSARDAAVVFMGEKLRELDGDF